MTRQRVWVGIVGMAVTCCSGNAVQHTPKAGPAAITIPDWVAGEHLRSDLLCGMGVAGAGFDADSPYPKQLSGDRAVANLAGVLGTQVQEAIVDQQESDGGNDVQLARVLRVDDSLVQQVGQVAHIEYWLDVAGVGPYAQKDFTYAHACISAADAQGAFKLDPKAFHDSSAQDGKERFDQTPHWLSFTGKQPGGRVCAIGYSEPTFFADKTFDSVVDDVRGQLAVVIQTLVSSYYEELSNGQTDVAQQMTVASTDAVSKGVIVTHYWHDLEGIGPYKTKHTTYGWGCVYPVDILKTTLANTQASLPEDSKHKIGQVRARAALAFEGLDAEEAKRAGATLGPAATAPQSKNSQSAHPVADGASE